MKKNKFCPYKKHCHDECYGENPCSFAKAFDGMQKKIDNLKAQNVKLVEENEKLRERVDWLETGDCV